MHRNLHIYTPSKLILTRANIKKISRKLIFKTNKLIFIKLVFRFWLCAYFLMIAYINLD
jgi:hypothetical protein